MIIPEAAPAQKNLLPHGALEVSATSQLRRERSDVTIELGRSQVMWLATRASNLGNALESLDLSEAGHGGFFKGLTEGYTRLTATAMDLIARIGDRFDLSRSDRPACYRQAEGLSKILNNVESITLREAELLKAAT